MKIYPIVEGFGEVEAVPVLIRRLLARASCYGVDVGRPIRRTQAQLLGEQTVQRAVRLALLQPDCAAVLILFDGDDGCPVEIAIKVRSWALAVAGGTPVEVVVAHREYETWFLASLESLRGQRSIRNDAKSPSDPEARRDAKGALEEWMPSNLAYSETRDQPALSAVFDMAVTFRRSRSFRKLVTGLGWLVTKLEPDRARESWPPSDW